MAGINVVEQKKVLRFGESGLVYDRVMAGLGMLFLIGLHVDGWAHYHGYVDESFFTPWHAVLYSSFGLTAIALWVPAVRRWRETGDWRSMAVPGYGLALVGTVVFAVGGVADLAWHELFGIEEDVEALISPSHLTLAVGGALMGLGPLRAAWFRPKNTLTRAESVPIILSAVGMLTILTFFTAYLHPLADPVSLVGERRALRANSYVAQQLGMAGVMLQTAFVSGVYLFIWKRWRWSLPFGSLTIVVTLNALAMAVLEDYYVLIWAMMGGGLVAELLVARLRPAERLRDLRLAAMIVPAGLYLAYFGLLIGIRPNQFEWSVHMWSGAVVHAALVGLLLSLLVAPPPVPETV